MNDELEIFIVASEAESITNNSINTYMIGRFLVDLSDVMEYAGLGIDFIEELKNGIECDKVIETFSKPLKDLEKVVKDKKIYKQHRKKYKTMAKKLKGFLKILDGFCKIHNANDSYAKFLFVTTESFNITNVSI